MRQASDRTLRQALLYSFAELLGYLEAGIGVVLENRKNSRLTVYLAIDGFGGQLVGLPRDRGAEAENFTGLRDFQDECLAVGGADRKFHASFAQDENAAGSLAFNEQHRTLRVGGRILDSLEGLEGRCRQVAEDAVRPHFAGQAAFDDVEPVR